MTLGALAFGILTVIVGGIIYGFDAFFSTLAILLTIAAALAIFVHRRWPVLVAAIASLFLAFVMFQLNYGGPTDRGGDIPELTRKLGSWFGIVMIVIGLSGFVAGLVAFRQAKQGAETSIT